MNQAQQANETPFKGEGDSYENSNFLPFAL